MPSLLFLFYGSTVAMLSQPEYRTYFTLELCTILFVPCHIFLRIFVTKLAPMYRSMLFYLLHCSSMPRSLSLCYSGAIVVPHFHECSAIQNVTKSGDVQHFFLVLSNIFPPLWRDWDLFSDALTYAYKTQADESTSVAPFELVLSRPPARLAFEATPSIDPVSDDAQYHKKWTNYAKALTSTARREMEKIQLRYKRGFGDWFMPYKEDVTVATYVFLRKD